MSKKDCLHMVSVAIRVISISLWIVVWLSWLNPVVIMAAATASFLAASTAIVAWLI